MTKMKNRIMQRVLSGLIVFCGALLAVLAIAQTPTVSIDARAGATVIDTGNPYFESSLTNLSNRNNFPRFNNVTERSPVGNSAASHAFYIKNSGGGVMERKCTLSGQLAQKADGSFAQRLVLDFWKNGAPLAINQPLQQRRVRIQARDDEEYDDDHDDDDEDDHDDDDDDDDDHHGGGHSGASRYTYVPTQVDTNTGKATYELRYSIPAGKQINLAFACYSAKPSTFLAVKFTCTGDDINNKVDTYFDDEFNCDVSASGNTTPPNNSRYAMGGRIVAAGKLAVVLSVNGRNYTVTNHAGDGSYQLGTFPSGSYYVRLLEQPNGVSCTFSQGGQTSTVKIDDAAANLPDLNCRGQVLNTKLFEDSFE